MHRPVIVAIIMLTGVAIIAAFTLLLPGLRPTSTVQPGAVATNTPSSANGTCTADADCVPAGCSSQLCVTSTEAASIVTTCEYQSSYACIALTTCGCVRGRCAWAENAAYTACLKTSASNVNMVQK